MEIGLVAQRHKPALLQGGHAAQLRKQNLVNRWWVVEPPKIIGQKQKEYLLWKVEVFKLLFQGKAKYIERIHPISKNKYGYWRHQSQSTPYLGHLQKIFYLNGKKEIPKDLEKYLSLKTLAVWYMDDGYFSKRDRSSYLYLGKVTKQVAIITSRVITKLFNLSNAILDKKRKGYVIYFSPRSVKRLKELFTK